MVQLLEYYGRWHGFRDRFSQLPALARLVVMLAALPGIVLIALSILVFLVSLLALLLLTVPLYRLLSAVCGVRLGEVVPAGFGGFGPPPVGMETVVEEAGSGRPATTVVVENPAAEPVRPARRQIEVKIVE